MDYWPRLPPVAQLPLRYRSWAWWLRNGPKRVHGTLAGSAMFRLISRFPAEPAFFTLHADGLPRLTIDLHDFECFHHTIPVWYRGDDELAALQAIMKDGGTLIDAGANYGAYALRIAQIPNTRVIAVEPQPSVAEALRRSAKENAFERFEVVEAALNDVSGTATLAVGFGSGSASLERIAPGAREVRVRAMTLDELQADDLRCIKLDVEMAEARVLRGGRETLARHRPVVVFEAGVAEPQEEVFAILRGFGYTQFVDQSGGPPRLDVELTNVIARCTA
jgi:FkbM family methyltransferase